MRKLFLLVSLVLAAGQVRSEDSGPAFEGGFKLLEYCSAPEATYRDGLCLGYTLGVHDSQSSLVALGISKPLYCMPTGVTAGQLRLVVKKWLQENPKDLHSAAGALVFAAFIEAFPCE